MKIYKRICCFGWQVRYRLLLKALFSLYSWFNDHVGQLMSIYLCWTINVNLFVTVFQRWIRARPDYHYSLVINGLASVSEKDAKMTKKGKNSGGTGKVAFFYCLLNLPTTMQPNCLNPNSLLGRAAGIIFLIVIYSHIIGLSFITMSFKVVF